MTCRYVFYPMTAKRIGRRMTIAERFRSWQRQRRLCKDTPDVYPVTGYYPPVYPGK